MAAKTPDSIRKENLGSINMLIATFEATNIDDDDTWTTGIKSIVGTPVVQTTIDGPQDCTIDNVSAAGVLTFASAANQTAVVYVYYKDM